MNASYVMRPIAFLRSDFGDKFGIPRQSGLSQVESIVEFEPEFYSTEALRGLEGFSHLWLIWVFSACEPGKWSPTVRPPRLGGNTRVGVFATRAPYRPNPIGLSCVELIRIEGHRLLVRGADLMDGTPILDIKPYIPYTDSRPGAAGGFSDAVRNHALEVCFPETLLALIPEPKRPALIQALAQDPRPGYRHDDPRRQFGLTYAGFDVRFTVQDELLTVREVVPCSKEKI